MASGISGPMLKKLWSSTSTGSPCGRHSCPAAGSCPSCSFFFASTLTTGCPSAWCALTCSLMYRNCASRSGCCAPSSVLAVPCRLKPLARSSWPTVGAETGCPRSVSSAARCRSDFVVQRSGDIGSPRSSGSTSPSSDVTRSGSCAVTGLRPPPARLARPAGSGSSPQSSSVTPRRTVVGLTPAAAATAATPPWPSSRASQASVSRCCRSFRCGSNTSNLVASWPRTSSSTRIADRRPRLREATACFLTGPVGAAALPGGAGQGRADGVDQAAVGVGGDELDSGEAAGGEVAEEGQPAGAVLGGGDLQAEDLPVPVGVHPGGDQGVHADHPAALADLQHERVGGDERVGPGVQRPVAEVRDVGVEILGHLADLGLGQPGDAQ